MSAATFLHQFIRNWKTVGAVAPSSPALAAQMMDCAGVAGARHILELGPGTGAFTGAIEKAMPKEASYLGIELIETFVQQLKPRFPALNFHVAGAQEFEFGTYLDNNDTFDVVVSGLPWTAFPRSLQEAILDNVLPHLAPGGRFATFAYYGFHRLPSGQRFRGLLSEKLSKVETSRVVWPNMPPAFVYVGSK